MNYIHVNFHHAPSILKQVPMSIEKRLSSLSSPGEIFEETVPYHEQYLPNFGYKEKLNYHDPTTTLQLIKKRFLKGHKFDKIFNKKALKLSYSCIPNIKTKTKSKKKTHIIEKFSETYYQKIPNTVNASKKKTCPMSGPCLQESLVYYATKTCNDKNYKPILYEGSCETNFQKRYSTHKQSLNVPLYNYDTKISKEYWNL